MNRPLSGAIPKFDVSVISGFIGLLLLYLFFDGITLDLSDPAKLYLSQATKEGADIAARTGLFHKMALTGVALLVGSYSLLSWLLRKGFVNAERLGAPTILAATGSILIVADLIGLGGLHSIKLVSTLFFASLILPIIGERVERLRALADPQVFINSCVVAIPLFAGIMTLFNAASIATNNLLWYLLSALSVGVIATVSGRYLKRGSAWVGLLPIAFIPLLLFIGIEWIIATKSSAILNSSKWVFAFVFLFALISFNIWNHLRPLNISTEKAMRRYFAPGAILSMALLSFYVPFPEQSSNIYELANEANALMRLFHFGEIPVVDYMSSHMLSDQFYGVIYFITHGYDGGLNFIAYRFITPLIQLMMVYYFALRVFGRPGLAVLLTFTFPWSNLFFSSSVFLGALAFFAIRDLVSQASIKNYMVLALTIVGLILWRLDAGVSGLIAAIIFTPLAFYSERSNAKIVNLVKAAGVMGAIGLLAVIVIIVLRSPSYLLNHFKSALHYVSADQAHGLFPMTWHLDHHFYFFHFIVPAISLGCIVFAVKHLRDSDNAPSFNRLFMSASVFFFIVALANFPRGLVRHGFMEHLDQYLTGTFYLALTLFIISLIKTNRTTIRYGSFVLVGFIALITIKHYPLSTGHSDFETFLRHNKLTDLDHKLKDMSLLDQRVSGFGGKDPEHYQQFISFIDEHLEPEQTFLDFANRPILYYYTQRKVPAYFCQSLQNTVDDYLQKQHLSYVDSHNTPIVVYSNYPPNWYDATDDVPNALRQYLIAEYIYQNYRPLGVVNDLSIWTTQSLALATDSLATDTISPKPSHYQYKKAARYIDQHFAIKQYTKLEKAASLSPNPISNDSLTYELPEQVDEMGGLFLQLEADNYMIDQMIEVQILAADQLIGTMTLQTEQNKHNYMLRLTNHYLWHVLKADKLLVIKDQNTTVSDLTIYKDTRP